MNRKQRRLSAKSGIGSGPKASELDELSRRAAAFYQVGRFQEAEAACRQILSAHPKNADANLLMGVIALSTARHEEAFGFLKLAVAGNRKNPMAHANLGMALSEMGRAVEARESLQTALRLQPAYPEALANLGNLEARMGNTGRAVELQARAVALQPKNPALRRSHGGALLRDGQLERAAQVFRDLLADEPADKAARYGLGLALRDLGDLDEAETVLRQASDDGGVHPDSALTLAWMSDSLSDQEAQAISEAEASSAEGSQDRMVLDFARAKVEHDRGDFEMAARLLRAGNSVRRQQLNYDRARVEADFDETISIFSREFFDRRKGYGHADETPVFVLGMPRSGTSLIEQILASHPDVHGAGELLTLREIGGFARGSGPQASPPQFAAALSKGATDTLGRNYVRAVRELDRESRFIVDKMPGNFMLIGLIRIILPNARIIHCTRDPRETCLSMYRTFFAGDGLAFAYDLDDLVHYYGLYAKLMDHWKGLFGDVIVDANHESLLKDPEGEIRALLASCDLEFAPQCLEFHKTRRDVRTASAAQVRKPLYDSALRGWRKYAEYLPELEALGQYAKAD
jgi:Flp pilus assembly protein TadD